MNLRPIFSIGSILLFMFVFTTTACSSSRNVYKTKSPEKIKTNVIKIERDPASTEFNNDAAYLRSLDKLIIKNLRKRRIVEFDKSPIKVVYKIISFKPGSRWGRYFTMGFARPTHSVLETQVKVYQNNKLISEFTNTAKIRFSLFFGGSSSGVFKLFASDFAIAIRTGLQGK